MTISISITSGRGYFGSVYTQTGGGTGKWYADETAIPGATASTYTMTSANEGKTISYRDDVGGAISNKIQLWTPEASGLSNLLADFDASLTANISESAGAVASMTSRVGVWQLQQATGADKPTYSATGRNSLPAISADGTSDHFSIVPGAGPALPVGTTPSTVFAMAFYNNTTGDNWRGLMMWGSGAAATNAGRNLHKSSGEFVASGGSSAEDCITTVSWPNNDRIVAFEYTSTGKRIFVDGNTTPTVKSLALNTGAATLARVFRGTTDYWRGSFQEIFVFAAALSNDDRQKAEGYLANKWGKTASLPSDHPYKSAAPSMLPVVTMASSGFLPTSASLVDTQAPGPITISVTSGTGYAGSVYTRNLASIGQWYAGETAIPGATGMTYTMEAKYEGKSIQFRASNGYVSNRIRLFTPQDVDGLLAWWDAYSPETITHASGVVSLWTSRIPSAWTLSQGTVGNRPDYSATGRNGLPAVVANGSSDYFFIDQTASLPTGTNPSTAVALSYWSNTTPGAWKALLNWGNGATQNRTIHKDVLENVAQAGGNSTFDNRSTVNWTNKDKIVFAEDTSAGRKLNIDGTTEVAKAVSFNSPNNNNGQVFTTDFWNGSLQDLMIFNKALSVSERQKIEGYLAAKWGLRALLPVGHPYKSTNPPPPGVEMTSSGYLPTSATLVHQKPKFTGAMTGYLPTSASLVDTSGVGPIVISLSSGTGYAGSVYTRDRASVGQWHAGPYTIPGATGINYTMEAKYEGFTIFFLAANGIRSNGIDLFAPSDISGLLAQWDAYAYETITETGGVVDSWASKWGNWTATQTTGASKPAYSATGRNGKPAITADGTNDYLDIIASGAGLPDDENCTIMTAAFFANVTPGAYRMLIKWGSVAAARRGVAKSDTEKVALIGGTVGTNSMSAVNWTNADKIVHANYQALGSVLNVDGNADISKVVTYTAPDQGAAYIFRDATLYWNGSAQEILIWNRTLTQAEREKVEGYIASKWGLRGLLPGGHPYKSTNPPASRSDITGAGFLPTSAMAVTVPFVINSAMTGYLPTSAMTGGQAINVTMASSGILPTMAGLFKSQEYDIIMTSSGYMPTSEMVAGFPQKINAAMVGYLPTQNLRVGYPLKVTMDSMGLLPTSVTWIATRTNINVAMTGFLPTQAAEIDLFDYTIEADMRGFMGESELGSNGLYKIDMDAWGRLPTSAMDIYIPQDITATSVMRGYLATMAVEMTLSMEAEIVSSGYLPTMAAVLGRAPYLITMDTWGFLPLGDTGGGSGDRPYASSPGFTTGGGINIGGGPTFSFGNIFRIG